MSKMKMPKEKQNARNPQRVLQKPVEECKQTELFAERLKI